MHQLITTYSEAETQALAAKLSLWARPGMVVLLQGDLGAGKSTFARAYLRALAGRDDLEVPSPTFTLVQGYEETRIPSFHADLYRLEKASDIAELGLGDMLQTQSGLVEWAERLAAPLSADELLVKITGRGDTREFSLFAKGAWAKALERNAAIDGFLVGSSVKKSPRLFLEGDASSRRYEWFDTPAKPILMDMPQRPDGPVVRDGKPYSAIANLAEGLTSVVAVNRHLTALGYSAPLMEKVDLVHGFALIENLGSDVYGKRLLAGRDMDAPMLAAAEVLADMATKDWPSEITLAEGQRHMVRPYDEAALLIEADLLPSWYFPYATGKDAPATVAKSFEVVWRKLIPFTRQDKPQWALRDFHSPNLIWIPERKGVQRVGLIDTQDAVIGHGAYDLVSMTQDARVDIPLALAGKTVEHYLSLRKADIGFDSASFMTAYAVLGAQRATKILGIFARLAKRDGKPGYLRHMPRVARALVQNLDHPKLSELRLWYKDHLPQVFS